MSIIKSFLDNPEEIITGAFLQFPLYFIIGWWVLPLMAICGVLWRVGGMSGGNKLFRRLGVPLVVCVATILVTHKWLVLLAVPFMLFLAPAYGENSWLFKVTKNDFLTRLICYAWFWAAFAIAYTF